MSAFVVTDETICLIAQAATLYAPDLTEDPDWLCTMLLRENVRSVNYRYPNAEPQIATPVSYRPVWRGEDPIEFKITAIKQIHCLDYQSCEHPEWKGSTAERALIALEASIMRTLPPSHMPGTDAYGLTWRQVPAYDAAPWGID